MTGADYWTYGVASLRDMVGDLGAMPAAVRSSLRSGFRESAQATLTAARANASWSTRIPGAISLRVATGSRNAGVTLRVGAGKAPHARPFEGISLRSNKFRHPVFGNRDKWVDQTVRPFLRPAVRDTQDAYMEAARAAVDQAAHIAQFS